MPTLTTISCPKCKQVFYSEWVVFASSYGPPIVYCGQCNSLLKTGLHKHVKKSDKIKAWSHLIWGLILLIGAVILSKDSGEERVGWICFFGLFFVMELFGTLLLLKKIHSYENSVEANSDDIPTWYRKNW
jgi:hypothetical protein